MYRVLVGFLLAAWLAEPALAGESNVANLYYNYPLDATAITYCRVAGKGGSSFGSGIAGNGRIQTSGSSATTVETTTDSNPFADLAVGDILSVRGLDGAVQNRVIITYTSDSSVAVNTAWDLSSPSGGYAFQWYRPICGTAATSGWVTVAGSDVTTITFQLDQVNVTGGIDMRIECRSGGLGTAAVQVFPTCTTGSCATVQNYTTAGLASRTTVVITAPFNECRMGVLINTADDGGDTGANEEQINGTITTHSYFTH